MSEKITQLIKNKLFKGFSIQELKSILNDGTYQIRNYPENTLVFQAFEQCESLAFVLSGSLVMHQCNANGDHISVRQVPSGETFGLALAFSDDPTYQFNITTTSETELLLIPMEQIRKMLSENRKFSLNYISFLSNMTQQFHYKVQILSQKEVLSKLILYFSREIKKNKSLTFMLSANKTEIAEMIGVARPSLSRELKHMQEEKIISLEGKMITILQPDMFLVFNHF